jgi:protein-disulfide isomerase
MPRRTFSRREIAQAATVAGLGWGGAMLLQRTAPLGRDLGINKTVAQIVADHSAPRIGPADANLTMAVFSDYQCPACKLTEPVMLAAARADGGVRIIFKEWPIFGGISERAARVALAGNLQGIYPALHERLMASRQRLSEQLLQEATVAVGGDWPRLLADLRTHGAAIESQVAATSHQAFALGLDGTPSFIIGSLLIIGGMDKATFARAFAQARAARP